MSVGRKLDIEFGMIIYEFLKLLKGQPPPAVYGSDNTEIIRLR